MSFLKKWFGRKETPLTLRMGDKTYPVVNGASDLLPGFTKAYSKDNQVVTILKEFSVPNGKNGRIYYYRLQCQSTGIFFLLQKEIFNTLFVI